jgi:hypothetical protein
MSSKMYERIIGGNLMNIKALGHMFKHHHHKDHHHGGAMSAGSDIADSMDDNGGAMSAGKMRLHKFIRKHK